MNKKEWLRSNWYVVVFFFIALALAFVAQAFYVQGYELNPADDMDIFCWNCTTFGLEPTIYLNQTINVMCMADANQTVYNGTCTIEKDMEGGEVIVNRDGNCDINVSCDSASCGRFQDVGYDGVLSVHKGNTSDSVYMDLVIDNFKGDEFFKWSRVIDPDEIITAEYPINFECPHEIITEVSMQTCADYLDPILGSSNPLIYALATAQNNCTTQLVACQAETISIRNDLKDCEVDLVACTDSKDDVIAQQMREKDAYTAEINKLNAEHIAYAKSHVAGWHAYAFYTLLIICILVVAAMFFSGGGEE